MNQGSVEDVDREGYERNGVALAGPWEWYERGYATPKGGWDNYDIHHIQPRELGGDNDFWNLVPVERSTHQAEFNSFWQEFME